jgi:hypothetical protein
MEELTMPKKFDDSPGAVKRRQGAMKRLENQLLTGYKSVKDELGNISSVKLTDDDIKRIKLEIDIIKTRLH